MQKMMKHRAGRDEPASSSNPMDTATWPPFNPFLRHPTSRLGKLRMVLTGMILLPIRLVGALVTLVLALVWVQIALIGCRNNDPSAVPYNSRVRQMFLMGGCRFFSRALLFFYGYLWIQETRLLDEDSSSSMVQAEPQASIVVCNHVGFTELLYLAARDGCCFVSKESNRKIPVIGKVAEAIQCIFVDRTNSKQGNATTHQILQRARAAPGTWPPLAICPEGTTTNGRVLIHFHTGAFRAGLPVQPVVFSLPFSPRYGYDPSFTCAHLKQHVLGLMTQPVNYLHVTYLPVYVPNEAEKVDTRLFANNVRRRMADALGVETYELTWKDKVQFEPKHSTKRASQSDTFREMPEPPILTHDAFGNPLLQNTPKKER